MKKNKNKLRGVFVNNLSFKESNLDLYCFYVINSNTKDSDIHEQC